MKKNSKIYVAGHRGLVGSAIMRKLQKEGYKNIVTKNHKDLDLTDSLAVRKFFVRVKPEYVFVAAAKVGGIMANKTYPADIIHNAYIAKTKKLLFLGSSCIYPRQAPQPIKEEYLLSGKLEPTNTAYAIAKISGIIMCQSYNKQFGTNFISLMPTNLYGPNDNFDLLNSHVLPALIRKFHEAKEGGLKEVSLWGTGRAKREFLEADDLADACIFLMDKYNENEIINVGTGKDVSIKKLAEKIQKIVGFKGKISWNTSKPDGPLRKLLDVSKINNLGWKYKTSLEDGLVQTYAWFLKNIDKVKKN